jgi:hypothetical protein
MLLGVFRLQEKLKVRQIVVRFVTVDVVDIKPVCDFAVG